jgi:hypothetical protein
MNIKISFLCLKISCSIRLHYVVDNDNGRFKEKLPPDSWPTPERFEMVDGIPRTPTNLFLTYACAWFRCVSVFSILVLICEFQANDPNEP